MDLDLFERVRRVVKIVVAGAVAAVAVMVIVAVMAGTWQSRNDDDTRRYPVTARAAALQVPLARSSPSALVVEAPRRPSGEQLRSEIAGAARSLLRGLGLDADASAAGDTLTIAANAGCDRNALVGIRDSLAKLDLALSEAFAAIRCDGGDELKLR